MSASLYTVISSLFLIWIPSNNFWRLPVTLMLIEVTKPRSFSFSFLMFQAPAHVFNSSSQSFNFGLSSRRGIRPTRRWRMLGNWSIHGFSSWWGIAWCTSSRIIWAMGPTCNCIWVFMLCVRRMSHFMTTRIRCITILTLLVTTTLFHFCMPVLVSVS